MTKSYCRRILPLYKKARSVLVNEGIERKVLDLRIKYKRRKPTAAFSSFLINNEIGAWMEDAIWREINNRFKDYKAVKYGRSEKVVAGEPGFEKVFNDACEEFSKHGKRPDLLIFPAQRAKKLGYDVTSMQWQNLPRITAQALLGLEIRSSHSRREVYEKVKGKPQSFTPKLEDLPLIMRWIKVHNKPLFYVQVFFDTMDIISFERILEIIKETGTEYIKTLEKNQRKSTFYIPINKGEKVGKWTKEPILSARKKVLSDGRVILYITPKGGRIWIDAQKLRSYLNLSPQGPQTGCFRFSPRRFC